ncbi:hypothetical protein SAMN04488498_103216 [Mesorhizobium albiziae]|uniref:Uncharacterized protein n=2 Tax=Neomesorhizobium albiziae TaxID=335020 RepID=A0A1I3XHZ8_9HYPH|nr:hypothetical protein GCM10007937_21790 [Mesorhizobium albiziae]SFK18691.1 hypothetical protein SAMN04488498_103216 [Mesorhizobium albiziae]
MMKKLSSVLTAAVLAMAFAMPLNAAPISVPKPEQVEANATQQVKHRRHWRHKHYRNWRSDRYWNRRHAWRDCRYDRCYPRRYYGHGRYYGYRDYYPRRYRRPGVSIYLEF